MTSHVKEMEYAAPVSSGEEDLRQYFHDISQYPLLTPQEECQLAICSAEGDLVAKEKMIQANLRLVVSIAKRYDGRGVALMDLIQEGNAALIKAVDKFDYTLDNHFSTYATTLIERGIIRCLSDNSVLSASNDMKRRARKVKEAREALLKLNNAEPTAEEIAVYCDLKKEDVLALSRLNTPVVFLDEPIDDEDTSLVDLLEDEGSSQPHEILLPDELKQIIEALLSRLEERQQKILRLHFGMEDGVVHSLDEIGNMLGISRQRAQQIKQQAIKKLKALGATKELEDFRA